MARTTPCWELSDIDKILSADAEFHTDKDHLFRAIHCQPSLQYKEEIDAVLNPATPEDILGKFMDQNRSQDMLCVVKGDSGMGKTHLIQWLRLNIDHEDSKNIVLNIPKNGMSLKNILKRIVNVLPQNEQQEYLEKLEGDGEEIANHGARKGRLLAEIIYEINYGEIPEKYKDFVEILSDFLGDTYLQRNYFLQDNHTVSAIAKHIFDDRREEETLGALRAFKEDDIPTIRSTEMEKLSPGGKSFIDAIGDDPNIKKTLVELLNIVLQQAIRRTLKLTGADLVNLMSKIRENIGRQGKCLILLIEDFASIDGIREPLLQALITPNSINGKTLCQLRWAMAITPGPLAIIQDTIRTRLNLIVDMDESKQASIAKMASGYLNALRWGAEELKIKNHNNPPSACDDCLDRETCHNSFGKVDGVGLFPFTDMGINLMAKKTKSFKEGKILNPRKFINSVLRCVLKDHHKTLENGTFPPSELLAKVGGENKLSNTAEMKLDELNDKFKDRRKTLLELWNGTGELGNFPKGLHESFRLPRLDGIPEFHSEDTHVNIQEIRPETKNDKEHEVETKTETGDIGETKTDKEHKVKIKTETGDISETNNITRTSTQVDPRLQGIQNWSQNNEEMDQHTAGQLRMLVYKHVVGHIDWDIEGFVQSEYASDSGSIPFKNVSINFEKQRDTGKRPVIILEIKKNPKEASALEALVNLQIHRNWEFKNSADHLTALLESLNKWSENVIEQLNNLYRRTSAWNPIQATTELISLHLLQSERINIDENEKEIRNKILKSSDFWFVEEKETIDSKSPETAFEKYFADIKSDLTTLTTYVSSVNLMTKGGARGNVKYPLELGNFIDNFFPQLEFSQKNLPEIDDIREEKLKKIIKLYSKTKKNFDTNLNNEKEKYKQWNIELIEYLGEGKDIKIFLDNFKNLLKVCKSHEIGENIDTLKILEDLQDEHIEWQNSINDLDNLSKANPMKSLILLSSIKINEKDIRDLIKLAEYKYKENSDVYQNKMADYTGYGDEKNDKIRMKGVKTWLDKIPEILAKINKLNEIK